MSNWATLSDQVLSTAIQAFASSVVYTPAGGSPVTISGVFDRDNQDVNLSHLPGVNSVAPTLGVRLADFAAKPGKGDTATVAGVTYRVIKVDEDGQGGATLHLQK